MKILREVKRKNTLEKKILQSKQDKSELEVLIETKKGKQSEVASKLRKIGRINHVYELIPFVSVTLEAGDVETFFNYLHKDTKHKPLQDILKQIISIDVVSECSKIPFPIRSTGDVYKEIRFDSLWNLRSIGAYKAQQISGGEDIKIGIIDTGIDYDHSQLRDFFKNNKGYDFVEGNKDPWDQEGHGTHVAGTACSLDYGVSNGSTLYAIRVLDEEGVGFESDVIAGIEWCIKNDINVANLSLGSPSASLAFEKICLAAYNNGLLLVAAAGNEGYGPSYPAAFDESVIAVAAVDESGNHAGFSNIWETNDISAPGVGILSCYPGGGYRLLSGTSMATPHVTGAVSLALSMFSKSPQDLESVIDRTAEPLDSDESYDNHWVYGSGLIRADNLLNRIIEDKRFKGILSKH